MQKLILFSFLLGLFTFSSCSDDDTVTDDTPDYHIHFNSPNTDDKNIGDEITVEIDFEDHNGGTVHHINVRIYDKVTGEDIMNLPTDAHVHETDGLFEFSENLILNVDAQTDWILEAKVWGDTDGLGEVTDSLEFHVQP